MSPNTWINKDRQRITFPRNLSSAASPRNTNLSKALGALGAISQDPWRSSVFGGRSERERQHRFVGTTLPLRSASSGSPAAPMRAQG